MTMYGQMQGQAMMNPGMYGHMMPQYAAHAGWPQMGQAANQHRQPVPMTAEQMAAAAAGHQHALPAGGALGAGPAAPAGLPSAGGAVGPGAAAPAAGAGSVPNAVESSAAGASQISQKMIDKAVAAKVLPAC